MLGLPHWAVRSSGWLSSKTMVTSVPPFAAARRSAGRHALGRQVGRRLIQPVHVAKHAGAADGNVPLGVEGLLVCCTTAAALAAGATHCTRAGLARYVAGASASPCASPKRHE